MSDVQLTHGDVSDSRGDRSSRGVAALLGRNEQMREVRQLIERVADTDATVLIAGESGTGKGLVARDIHSASPRRDRPFVKVNCAALPSELLESELFGFERGAFTGAVQHRPGKFEFAHQGTMFLDEISELTLPLQSKLLQVLQDGEFSRLGGRDDVHVDVRVVAATNQDMERAVVERTFREDLFFRLNVVCITLPPLRQRRDEIPLLTDVFLQQYATRYNKARLTVSAATLRVFTEYDWPGNVRELENFVKRIVILGDDGQVAQDLADMMSGRKAIGAQSRHSSRARRRATYHLQHRRRRQPGHHLCHPMSRRHRSADRLRRLHATPRAKRSEKSSTAHCSKHAGIAVKLPTF